MKEVVPTYTAFLGQKLLESGTLEEVVLAVRKETKNKPSEAPLIFSDLTGKEMDFDLRGSEKEVLDRLKIYRQQEEDSTPTGPGRPKLGVVAREVSLLPRHWEWLSNQPGGASATLRRLVDEARRDPSGKENIKQAQERTYKFMSTMAGNLPHYEEALRALYAKDKKKFLDQIVDWPKDIKDHAKRLSGPVFQGK